MQNFTKCLQVFLIALLLSGCSPDPSLPDLSTIPWITTLGYDSSELFPVLSGRTVPGPQIKVTVEAQSQYLLIDINTIDLLVRENAYKNINFEPQRMANRTNGSNELMVEEGYLHNVSLLNMDFPMLYAAMIKRSEEPFHANGLIGRNYLINGQMTIDMSHKIFAFSTEPAVPLSGLSADSNLIDFNLIHLNDEHSGLLKFYCRVNGQPALATLSTQQFQTQVSAELAESLTGKTGRSAVTLESLQMGNTIIHGIKTAVNPDLLILEPENSESIDVVIAMDVISQGAWTIDFINQKILIGPFR